jgi:hypothetical protein
VTTQKIGMLFQKKRETRIEYYRNIITYLEAVQGLTHKIIMMKKIKISQETTNAMKR